MLNKIKIYTLVIFLSLIFSFYFFETYQTFYIGENNLKEKIKILKKKENINYDLRTKFEAYKDLKKKIPNLVTLTVPKTHVLLNAHNELLPLSGISKRVTLVCNENGYFSKFESDRFGFNNPDYEWDKEKIEFLLLGDSFTIGECVNRPHDFGSLLRKLSKKSVLNLGYSSNGPLIELAILKEYLIKDTTNVIWFFYEGNDLQDLSDTYDSEHLNKYLYENDYKQFLTLKQMQIDELNFQVLKEFINYFEDKQKKSKRNNFLRFLRLDKTKKVIKDIFSEERPIQINDKVFLKLKEIIKEAENFSKKNGSNFYFVYLPSFQSFENETSNFHKIQKDKIVSILDELNIKLIDIKKELIKNNVDYRNIFPFGFSGHFNKNGYDIIANIISKSIKNN